jgi:transposase-like protein
VGALSTGEKSLLACESGVRESKKSWLKVLRDPKARGLNLAWLTIADGNLGVWAAVGEPHPEGEEQRCWNHKITNMADDLPKKEQRREIKLLKAMSYAETRAECAPLRDAFAACYAKTDPKAVATLLKDWERMVIFYRFPKEPWIHLRTTHIVESPFSAVRLRTDAAKRHKKVAHATTVIWKMLLVAEKSFRKLDELELLEEVWNGTRFVDGERVTKHAGRIAT